LRCDLKFEVIAVLVEKFQLRLREVSKQSREISN